MRYLVCVFAILLATLALAREVSAPKSVNQRVRLGATVLNLTPRFKYVLLRSWDEGQRKSAMYLANRVEEKDGYCLYDGHVSYVTKSGQRIWEDAVSNEKAVVYTPGRCPVVGTEFVIVDPAVPEPDLGLIKRAIDQAWAAECKRDADNCRIFRPNEITMFQIRAGTDTVEAHFGLDTSLLVRRVGNGYVASGFPITIPE